jgi:hypothetical protein
MVQYWRATPPPDVDPEEVFHGHMRCLNRQRALGLNLFSGPFDDGSELRGISVYDSHDVDEMRGRLAEDPAVAMGTPRVDLRLRWSTPGSTLAP